MLSFNILWRWSIKEIYLVLQDILHVLVNRAICTSVSSFAFVYVVKLFSSNYEVQCLFANTLSIILVRFNYSFTDEGDVALLVVPVI